MRIKQKRNGNPQMPNDQISTATQRKSADADTCKSVVSELEAYTCELEQRVCELEAQLEIWQARC